MFPDCWGVNHRFRAPQPDRRDRKSLFRRNISRQLLHEVSVHPVSLKIETVWERSEKNQNFLKDLGGSAFPLPVCSLDLSSHWHHTEEHLLALPSSLYQWVLDPFPPLLLAWAWKGRAQLDLLRSTGEGTRPGGPGFSSRVLGPNFPLSSSMTFVTSKNLVAERYFCAVVLFESPGMWACEWLCLATLF